MRKILIAFLLVASFSFAAEQRLTFKGTATATSAQLPTGASALTAFQAREVCVWNLSTTDNLYVKACIGTTCVADDTTSAITDGTGFDIWILPPQSAGNARPVCFQTAGIRKLAVDCEATKTAAYFITMTGQ